MNEFDVSQGVDKLFKVKKIHYNTYDIQHPDIRGQLRVITIPKNFLQLPDQLSELGNIPSIALASQTLVSFTNLGEKRTDPSEGITPESLKTAQKADLTRFCENHHEPWCEFVLQGNPPLVARLKTVLTRVEWIKGHSTETKDPVLWANTNISMDVSIMADSEAGLE